MTSAYAQCSTWCRFWFLKISFKKTTLICIVVLCFPQSNNVCIHMYDECKRSNVLNVCHMLGSIWWQHVQVCSRSTQCLVYQCVPIANIWGQFASELLTTLQQLPFLLPWIGGRQCMVLRLCLDVELFCSPVRNIFTQFFAWPSMS